jgi:Ca2+-binding RTX toxin-like protein
MSSQQWQGSTLALNSQADNTNGLLPQYFTTNNPNFINLAVKSEQPDTLGRFGRNRDYQMYSSPYWQRGVWEYTQEAVFSKDSTKVDLALKGLEFAFSKQLSNGNFSFVPVPDLAESSQQDVGLNGQSDLRATAFFMASLGTCLTTYQESQWFQTDSQNQSFQERLTLLTPKIQKALNFLNLGSNVSTLQKDSNDTNRIWYWALAYYGAGKFLGDPKAQQIGLNFAQKALSQFDPATGIFLENGGGDSSYQAVNMVVASRFSFLLEKNDPLRTKIQQAVVKGAAWEQSKILSTGEVSTDGNSRIYDGGENFMGKEKVIDKKQVVLGMSYAALFSDNQTYWRTAERVSDFYSLDYTTPGVLSFSSPTFSVNEDGTPVSAVTIIRAGGSYGSVSATLSMNNGTATNSDYDKSPIVINFADGDSTPKVIKIPIVEDGVRESNEALSLNLSRPQGRVSIGSQRTAVLTIVDNDLIPTVTITPATLSQEEGNSGTSTFTFTVNLSRSSYQTITVPYATQDGTAIAGSDYITNSGTLTFNPGEVSKKISITANRDTAVELDETFTVKLSNPTNATLSVNAQSTVTMVNDDTVLAFSAPIFSVNENGTPVNAITVTRSGSSKGAVSATLWVTKNTAVDPHDFTNTNANPPVITFADGDTTPQVVRLPIINDSIVEPNETLNLRLSGRATTGGQNTAVLTILDDDSLPMVTVNPASVNLAENSSGTTPFTFTVNLSRPFSQTVTVPFTTQNGTAIAGSDFIGNSGVLSFNPGQTTQTFTVNVRADDASETDETFIVKLGTPKNASLGTVRQSTIKISDYNSGTSSTVLGTNGADTLTGGSGNDTLMGGRGNDVYYVHNIGDMIAETSAIATEIDTVRAYVSYTIGANIERLSLRGNSNLNGTGNNLNNLIAGNTGNNILNGQAGDDTLIGYAGNDIFANASGNDTLTGGAGNDRFHYVTGNVFSTAAIGIDRITDFSRVVGNTDSLVLSRTTFEAGTNFASVSSDALAGTNSAYITFSTATGRLFYNQNGSTAGLGTGAQFATLNSINGTAINANNTLLATDFSVVA